MTETHKFFKVDDATIYQNGFSYSFDRYLDPPKSNGDLQLQQSFHCALKKEQKCPSRIHVTGSWEVDKRGRKFMLGIVKKGDHTHGPAYRDTTPKLRFYKNDDGSVRRNGFVYSLHHELDPPKQIADFQWHQTYRCAKSVNDQKNCRAKIYTTGQWEVNKRKLEYQLGIFKNCIHSHELDQDSNEEDNNGQNTFVSAASLSTHTMDLVVEEFSPEETKKMRRSARMAEKKVKAKNDSQKEPKAKKKRSNDKIANIANNMDNGTMVETFKYLNYCQLAESSLVSKRFRDLIQKHRHILALLYVPSIGMDFLPNVRATIKIFGKQLTPETYNEWTIRNGYSKHAPLQDHIVSTQCAQNIQDVSSFYAYAHYKGPSHREWDDKTSVFSAHIKQNHDNWPVFQHFVRLVTDPFIYIENLELSYQKDVLNLLAEAINSDYDRLRCKELAFDTNGNCQKSFTFVKKHVRCDLFCIYDECHLKQGDALWMTAFLDFFMTGAHCTPSISISNYDLSKVFVDFVQKFLDLENWNEYQYDLFVESYQIVKDQHILALKKDFGKFFVKEERKENNGNTAYVFEFVNRAIGKKLQLTASIFDDEKNYTFDCSFLLEIKHLQ